MESQQQVKVLFLLIDGIADTHIPELENKTPLQYSKILTFNAISSSGLNGIMDPVEPGLACGSDCAHLNIFGYNPFEVYRGRGSFETMGSGIPMIDNEIAFKCNFAYMDKETKIVHKRRVDRAFDQWGLPLIDALDNLKIPGYEGYHIRAKHATEHRCGIKVSGGEMLSNKITGTDPLKDNLKLRKVFPIDENDEKSKFTAGLINSLSGEIHSVLQSHQLNLQRIKDGKNPGNIVLLRGCGQKLNVPSFQEKHGMKGFMVAPTAIIKGIGQSIQLTTPDVEGATGDYHSNYFKKMDAALELFQDKNDNYDFGFVHVKAVDDAGHDKSYQKKLEYLQKVDEALLYFLNKIIKQQDNNEYIILLTGDHTTPIKIGDHTFEPVPLTVSTSSAIMNKLNIKKCDNLDLLGLCDGVQQYDEQSINYIKIIQKACGHGVLGRFVGLEVFNIIKNMRKVVQSILK